MTSSCDIKRGDLIAMWTTVYSKPRFAIAVSVTPIYNGFHVIHEDLCGVKDRYAVWRVEKCAMTFAGPGVKVEPEPWPDAD